MVMADHMLEDVAAELLNGDVAPPPAGNNWGRGSVEYSSGIALFSFREMKNGLIGRRQPPDRGR